jgi:hypothetical protein
MGTTIKLNLAGLDTIGPKTRAEVIVEIRRVMGPLVEAAGKRLIITTGPHRGDLNIEFDSETDTTSGGICNGKSSILGEDAGEAVFVRAHKALRVCGPIKGNAKRLDTRRVLTASWLLGPALASTAIHELGHFIASLDHVNDAANFMSTMGPPKDQRTMASQREFWAGRKTFLESQRKKLVEQLRKEEWLGDMQIQTF